MRRRLTAFGSRSGVGRPPTARHAELDEVAALSRELIAQNHLEIGRADGKAAVLLATGGSLLGLLLVRRPPGSSWTLPFWWIATITTTGALLLLLMALLPRRGTRIALSARAPAYYEDVVRAEERADLWAGLRLGGSDPRLPLLRALTGTSRIARAKNRCVRCAVLVLLPAVATAFPALTSTV
ncbi:Pycsar system effector family protein [Streptomyces atacamensis]|uniref:Pycsar system effector family protein n=1 Tax=Streptomyces atacamensis TaxID=531966 RepID=UPI00399C88A3